MLVNNCTHLITFIVDQFFVILYKNVTGMQKVEAKVWKYSIHTRVIISICNNFCET